MKVNERMHASWNIIKNIGGYKMPDWKSSLLNDSNVMTNWYIEGKTTSDQSESPFPENSNPQSTEEAYDSWLNQKTALSQSQFVGGMNSNVGGLLNLPGNLGTGKDLQMYNSRIAPGYQNQVFYSTFYRTSYIGKRILNIWTDALCSKPLKFLNLTSDQENKIKEKWRYHRLDHVIRQATRDMLLHGGCALFIESGDAYQWGEPLNKYRLRNAFKGFVLVERSLMYPTNFFAPAVSGSGTLAEPETWTLIYPMGVNNFKSFGRNIDSSRFIFFIPEELPFYARLSALFWGDSIFTTTRNLINAVEGSTSSALTLTSQAHLRFLKTSYESVLVNASTINKINRSFNDALDSNHLNQGNNMHVLGKHDDIVSLEVRNLKDINAIVSNSINQIIAAHGIPITRFWSNTELLQPATDTDLVQWFDEVAVKQEAWLRRPISLLLEKIGINLGWEQQIDFEFAPLHEENKPRLADIGLKEAQTYGIYRNMGMPAEVLLKEMRQKNTFSFLSDKDIPEIARKMEEAIKSKDALGDSEAKDMKDDQTHQGTPVEKTPRSSPESVTKEGIKK